MMHLHFMNQATAASS